MSSRPRGIKRDIARIVLIMVVMGAGAWALSRPEVKALFDVAAMKEEMRRAGRWAPLAFSALALMANFFGFPRLAVAAIAGTIFGAFEGTVLALFTTTLGALANYWFARSLGRKAVARRFPARVKKWNAWFEKAGFETMLLIRLFPVGNATVTNLLAGVSSLRSGPFMAATFLGFLPLTVVFALFGSSLGKGSRWQLMLGGVIMFALTAGCLWFKKKRDGHTPDEDEEG